MGKITKFRFSFIALLLVFSIYGGAKSAKASEFELTQEKKEELYNQYVEIVAEVSALYPNEKIFINPLDTFEDEHFMTPEEYREFIVDLATSYVIVEPEKSSGITSFAIGSTTRNATINIGSNTSKNIAVTGSFTIDNYLERMGFSAIRSITSRATEGRGTWSQTGYNGAIYDMGETYNVTVTGKHTENSSTKEYIFSIEFYCSGTGNIS